MLKFSNLLVGRVMAAENHLKNSAVEADTTSKNKRSTSLKSSGNFFGVICSLLLALCIGFYACGDDDDDKTFTVTFESNGGSSVANQTVKAGEKATKPVDPTRDQYSFDAWYKEATLSNVWNFDTDVVSANVTLFAKWSETVINAAFDGNIDANVVDGVYLNSVVNAVRFSFYDHNDCEPRQLASGQFSGGSFSVNLPSAVPNSFLVTVLDALYATRLTISDANARMAVGPLGQCGEFAFIGYDHSNNEIGHFYLADQDFINVGLVVYADRDVTVNGSENDLIWDNILFKAGWNMIYLNPEYGGRVTTTAPNGVRWRFESFED